MFFARECITNFDEGNKFIKIQKLYPIVLIIFKFAEKKSILISIHITFILRKQAKQPYLDSVKTVKTNFLALLNAGSRLWRKA